MTDIKRYDCTNGRAQHCYGCYQMTESEYGDYVEFEEHSRIVAAKDARITELEQSQGAEVFLTLTGEISKLRAQLDSQQQAEPLIDTSAWQSCNPGCDPEFNGEKGRHCVCDPAKAAMSAKKANSINPEMVDVVGYTTAGMLSISKDLPLTGRIGAKCKPDERWNVPLMTVAQHSRIVDAERGAHLSQLRDWRVKFMNLEAAKEAEIARLNAGLKVEAEDKHEALAELRELRAQPARQVGDVQLTGEYHADVNMLLERIPRHVVGDGVNWKAVASEQKGIIEGLQARIASLAPAAVVMPRRMSYTVGHNSKAQYVPLKNPYADGWNAALDEVARLNRRAIPAGLLEKAADLLKSYQQVIDGCHSSEIERFDYQPEVQGTADELRALLGKEGE